jgi:hypothetical protein
MPPVGFETTIPASARPRTYALDRAANRIGVIFLYSNEKKSMQEYYIRQNLSKDFSKAEENFWCTNVDV